VEIEGMFAVNRAIADAKNIKAELKLQGECHEAAESMAKSAQMAASEGQVRYVRRYIDNKTAYCVRDALRDKGFKWVKVMERLGWYEVIIGEW
jgi:hypothetical protein